MSQKICVISFDHWNYDYHIANALTDLGHKGTHIKIGDYDHKNVTDKITNAFSKFFLKKNLKKIRRQDYILECLEAMGPQDQILVINPEVIDLNHHNEIKKHTKRYIAYLYDSVDRNPIDHLLYGVFDAIYSFDKNDITTYGFLPLSNYIYLPKTKIEKPTKYDVVYVGSFDDRVSKLIEIALFLKENNIKFKFLVVGKNKRLRSLKNEQSSLIDFRENSLSQTEVIEYYKDSKIIIDLIRDNQTGLSFRFFEALALDKKIITNNERVKDYDFFNPQNILILNDSAIPDLSFLESAYIPVENSVYNAFTLQTWVKKLFKLE